MTRLAELESKLRHLQREVTKTRKEIEMEEFRQWKRTKSQKSEGAKEEAIESPEAKQSSPIAEKEKQVIA